MTTEMLGVLVTAINVVMTAYIAYAVQKAGRNGVKMEQDRGIKGAWIEIDRTALASSQDLDLLDAMIHPDKTKDRQIDRRKRWLAYMVLNPLEAAWSSASSGNMQLGALASSERTMRGMVADDTVYELIQQFVYGTDFQKRCAALREELLEERAKSKSAAQESVRPPSTCNSSPVQ